MSATEFDLAVEWAAREGWNPGLNDALAFRAADPAGFLVGLKDGVPLTSSCPAITRSVVVLPQPDGPSRQQ